MQKNNLLDTILRYFKIREQNSTNFNYSYQKFIRISSIQILVHIISYKLIASSY